MNEILNIIYSIPAMIIAFTCHEFTHAYVADKMGDKTPRFQGRLTLNPVKHIDPFGFLAVLLFRFGWAKPVQTNPVAYKNYYKDDLKVSAAGPIMNFIVAIIFAIILGIFVGVAPAILSNTIYRFFWFMIYYIIMININIGIFNLIPFPGLDGFHILRDLFPKQFYKYEAKMQGYQMIGMMILLLVGGRIIYYPANLIINSLLSLSNLIMQII